MTGSVFRMLSESRRPTATEAGGASSRARGLNPGRAGNKRRRRRFAEVLVEGFARVLGSTQRAGKRRKQKWRALAALAASRGWPARPPPATRRASGRVPAMEDPKPPHKRAHGVVASHPLRMRKALDSIPSVSMHFAGPKNEFPREAFAKNKPSSSICKVPSFRGSNRNGTGGGFPGVDRRAGRTLRSVAKAAGLSGRQWRPRGRQRGRGGGVV